ncbi:MAG TPA: DEAD/DEAH box helicase, partial [Acidimicrobiales bacterium]|nr:DEAD/DEAH box helicase [Acidimicrobiales bacterium]
MERLFFMPAPRSSSQRAHNPARRRPTRPNRGATKSGRPRVSPSSELEAALDAALLTAPPADATFASLGLPKSLVIALEKRGIKAPFAIQARAIPDALAGRDVLGRAQTGGGKTLAFGLPLLARLWSSSSRRTPKTPGALVLVPTRELATQVADALRPLGEALGLKLACVFGGAPYGRQIEALERGVDIVVATPGRLIDLIEKGVCVLAAVEIAVLDEADHMADLGFLPAVTTLLDQTPSDGQRMLFSATLDRGVDRLVRAYLADPALHAVAPAAAPIEAMEHRVFALRAEDKVAVVTEVASRPARTLIFVRTKHGADRLATQLTRAGVDAAAIHGNLKQNARQRALDGFAAGHPRVLVATDVAARGIHVDDVDLVVHFDPPNDSKDYLHRSGRTARAGATGTALMLVLPHEVRAVAAIHRDAGVSPEAVEVSPGHDAVRELAASGEPIPVLAPRKHAGRPKRTERPERSPRPAGDTHRPRRAPNQPRTPEERFARKTGAKARTRKPRHRQVAADNRREA